MCLVGTYIILPTENYWPTSTSQPTVLQHFVLQLLTLFIQVSNLNLASWQRWRTWTLPHRKSSLGPATPASWKLIILAFSDSYATVIHGRDQPDLLGEARLCLSGKWIFPHRRKQGGLVKLKVERSKLWHDLLCDHEKVIELPYREILTVIVSLLRDRSQVGRYSPPNASIWLGAISKDTSDKKKGRGDSLYSVPTLFFILIKINFVL